MYIEHPNYERSASGCAGRRCDLRSDRREAPRSAPFLRIQRSDSKRLAARDAVPPCAVLGPSTTRTMTHRAMTVTLNRDSEHISGSWPVFAYLLLARLLQGVPADERIYRRLTNGCRDLLGISSNEVRSIVHPARLTSAGCLGILIPPHGPDPNRWTG